MQMPERTSFTAKVPAEQENFAIAAPPDAQCATACPNPLLRRPCLLHMVTTLNDWLGIPDDLCAAG